MTSSNAEVSTSTNRKIVGPTSRTPICWIDGQWTAISDFGLTIATQGLHYGTGVFEGIRAYWKEQDACAYVVRIEEHINRFLDSCQLVRIDPGVTATEMRQIILEVVERNEFLGDLYIRPIAFKSQLAAGAPFGVGLAEVEDRMAVYATPMPSRKRLNRIRCSISGWRRIPGDCIPARAKITGSYVNVALAVDEARAAGYDDAILLNTRGTVAEASTANVFVVSRGKLATPSLDCDVLEGQTRACILELAVELGIFAEERPVSVSELYTADEIFITGTACEVTSVIEINGRAVKTGKPGPVTEYMFDTYRSIVTRTVGDHQEWTEQVRPFLRNA
ncbi:branched-chain amino acid transaminase [Rhodococcus erythropolis]|uniref:branched-chain amino acid transaminase n=1 Tax=Rhodococcus erythropolis TaxID=1833 RepID=UPI0008BF4569|nr:branched-chain amino acid transaminase [Rhodococcus erythropolis]OFV78034.1 branched-chain-amino-acid aminotransferase [Rhodococcus erythropolis]